jgi:hypothetical protein
MKQICKPISYGRLYIVVCTHLKQGQGAKKLGYLDTLAQTDYSSYILADILNIHTNMYCNCLNIYVAMSLRM